MIFFKILLALIAAYVLLALVAFFFADTIAFPAPKPSYEMDKSRNYFHIPMPSGEKISVLWFENPNAKQTILYSHGNGEDLGEIRPFLEHLQSAGFNVMAYDYPGYGQSEGKAGADKVYPCAETVWNFLVQEKRIDPSDIAVWGYSMGSSAATWLAAEKNPRALILVGGFASALHALLPVNIFPWEMLNNERLLKNVTCPVMIVHGKKDLVVPFRNAKRLYAAANEPKKLFTIDQAGHFDIPDYAPQVFYTGILDFIRTLNFPGSE